MEEAKSPLSKTFQGYGSVASISGVLYLFDNSYSKLSRFFWFIIGIALIVIAALLIQQSYNNWQGNLVITTINTTGYPIRDIEFPAITICGQGLVNTSIISAQMRQVFNYLKDTNVTVPEWPPLNYSALLNLLEKSNRTEDFLYSLYPGLDDPHAVDLVIKGYTIVNFDSYLRYLVLPNAQNTNCPSENSSNNNNSSSSSSNNNNITELCGSDEYAYDDTGKYCYRLTGPTTVNLVNAKYICQRDENGFDIKDDEQLSALLKLVSSQSGPLAKLSNGTAFWTSTIRDVFSGNFLFPYVYTSVNLSSISSLYRNIEILTSDDNHICFSMQYNKTSGKFDGNTANCAQSLAVICYKHICPTPQDVIINNNWQNSQYLELTNYAEIMSKSFSAFSSIFEVMWYSGLPCFYTRFDFGGYGDTLLPMIYSCKWKNTPIVCAAIFKAIPTDIGMCCSFNMEAADQIFQEGKYQNMINKMQAVDNQTVNDCPLTNAWIHGSRDCLSKYKESNEPVPQSGIKNGLSIILDAHTNLVGNYLPPDDFQGFSVKVGARNEFSQLNEKRIAIRPGSVNFVGISATLIESSDDIKSISPHKRACYFPDEYKLNLHKNYSQANCMLECQMRLASDATLRAMQSCSDEKICLKGKPILPDTYRYTKLCTPWLLPMTNNDNTTICSPMEAQAYAKYMQISTGDACDYCYPDCTLTKYTTQVTTLPFRQCKKSTFYCESEICCLTTNIAVRKDYNNEFYDILANDIAEIQFYFESPTAIQYTSDPQMTSVDFLGLVGGFIGLCNGFSLCSAVEIIFWFTAMWWKAEEEKRKEQKAVDKAFGSKRVIPLS